MIPLIRSTLLAALLVVPTVALTAAAVPPESASPATHIHPDGHDLQHPPAAEAAPAVRWQADEPLRAGMRRVRAATEALARAAHGHADAARTTAIADELKAAVAMMFAQCQLAPAPDAALHPLLAEVLRASTRLSEGHDGAALEVLQAVLVRYAELFEDAEWHANHVP
jgi:hypothetical protein